MTAARGRVEHLESAGGVVCRLNGDEVEVVICGRHSPEGWTWGLPKGTPGSGETTEETGLKVILEAPIDSIRYWFVRPTDGVRCHKTVHFYLMSPVGGSISEHDLEFDLVHWSRSREALQTLTYKNEVNILKKAVKMVSGRPEDRRNVD